MLFSLVLGCRPLPVLAGLFASAAAVVVALVYELLVSGVRQDASGS